MVKIKSVEMEIPESKRAKKLANIARIGARLFATNGYIETSMNDIAAAAKVTKGGIYYYFESKTDILYYISSSYIDQDRLGLKESLENIPDISEKIKYIIFRHISHYAGNPSAAKTLLHESYNLPPKLLKEIRIRERDYFEIVNATVSEFVGKKPKKELITTLTFTLFGMMNWIYKWYDPKGRINPTDLSTIIYDTFSHGVKKSIS